MIDLDNGCQVTMLNHKKNEILLKAVQLKSLSEGIISICGNVDDDILSGLMAALHPQYKLIGEAKIDSIDERVARRLRKVGNKIKLPGNIEPQQKAFLKPKSVNTDPRNTARGRANFKGSKKERQTEYKRKHAKRIVEVVQFVNDNEDKSIVEQALAIFNKFQSPAVNFYLYTIATSDSRFKPLYEAIRLLNNNDAFNFLWLDDETFEVALEQANLMRIILSECYNDVSLICEDKSIIVRYGDGKPLDLIDECIMIGDAYQCPHCSRLIEDQSVTIVCVNDQTYYNHNLCNNYVNMSIKSV